MKVSAVIVTYNRLALLKRGLNALLNQSYSLNNIYVINNNSSDGTYDYLNNLNNSKVIPVNLHKNLGGAGGFSKGTKLAFTDSNSDYFWLMDDDSLPTRNALKNLMISVKDLHNNFGFLCSNVRWWKNHKPCLANVPKVSKDWNESLNKGLVKLTSATFVSVLVKRNNVAKLGLPIAELFIWGDDTEFTTRLSRKSRSYLVSSSIVNHESAENADGNSGSIFNIAPNRIFYYKYGTRNLLFIYRKYYSKAKMSKLLLSDIFNLVRIPFNSNDHRWIRFKCFFSGIIKGLFFYPSVKFPK